MPSSLDGLRRTIARTDTDDARGMLARPTTGREQRTRRLLDPNRETLQDLSDAGSNTVSTVIDVLTPDNLPYRATDALKSAVPKLRRTYIAEKLDDEYPI